MIRGTSKQRSASCLRFAAMRPEAPSEEEGALRLVRGPNKFQHAALSRAGLFLGRSVTGGQPNRGGALVDCALAGGDDDPLGRGRYLPRSLSSSALRDTSSIRVARLFLRTPSTCGRVRAIRTNCDGNATKS